MDTEYSGREIFFDMKTIANIKYIVRKKLFKKPTQVVLEATNRCNLNCPYCMVGMQNELISKHGSASHSLMTRPLGVMSEEVFYVVLNNLKEFGIRKVYLHFQGEPFLNPLTPRLAKILKQNKFEVGIFTNGMAFNDKNTKEVADAEIDLIRFSVDGASPETYKKNRVGGDFNKVFENMKRVALAHRTKNTRLEWQFIALKNNEHEVEKARHMAKEIGIHFFIKGFRETDPELAPKNSKYKASFLNKPCKDIYRSLGIYWNGDIVPCCYDTDDFEVMGNVKKNGLSDIWNSHKYRDFRARVDNALIKPEEEPSLCKSCLRWK